MAEFNEQALTDAFIRVGTVEELQAKGMMVVQGARCPLLVLHDRGSIFALDNRCPHLGFPLHRGSVEDGILTCHWHHARFDLASGCTFDLWADDIPTTAVELRDGAVWVAPETRFTDGEAHWRNRLREGLEHDIALVIAKAILGLIKEGADPRTLVRETVLFGARNRDDWGTGLTILTAFANLLPMLPPRSRPTSPSTRGSAGSRGIATVNPPGAPAIRWGPGSPCRCCGAGCGTGPGCGTATGPNGHC